MTLSVVEGHFLLQAFLSVIFRNRGASRGHSVSAELFVLFNNNPQWIHRETLCSRNVIRYCTM